MTKICICDIDGVVADSTARFAKAEEAKQAFVNRMQEKRVSLDYSVIQANANANEVYWQAAFTPELVALDTLIDGAKEALETLRFRRGYQPIFLTSRPEAMRNATIQWLYEYGILFFFDDRAALVMKAPAFQFTKTTVWKAGIVQTLAALYGAEDVVFVDDEINNVREVQKYEPIPLVFMSLAEAIEKL